MRSEDWLDTFKGIGVEAQKEALAIWGTTEAGRELGKGAGGDTTVLMDKVLEDCILRRMEEVGDVFLVSEERGHVEIGSPKALVIADPLDGSFNAKTGIPVFSISLALGAPGGSMGDLTLGYVRNLITGDEYHAIRGKGAFLNQDPIQTSDRECISVIGMECHPNTVLALEQNLAIVDNDTRLRSLGCISLDLCHVARGIFDTYIDVRGRLTRIVDIAAGKVIIEEAGGTVTDERGSSLDSVVVDVHKRVDLIASGNGTIHGIVMERLKEKGFIE